MQLDDLRLFVATLDAGSFTAAADRLGLSKQFVSRRTIALEAELGVRLLNRTTRRLQPTELGLELYERARRILDEVDETCELLASQGASPRGTLRLTAPVTFGTMHLSGLLPGFLRQCPLVQLELDLSDRVVDLVAEGYDMAIRIGVLADSSLRARRLGDVELVTCASPAYLAEHPAPATPADLAAHRCLLYGHGRHVEWRFARHGKTFSVPVRGPLRVNNGEIARDAALAGLGIAAVPSFMLGDALATGALVSVLDDFRPPAFGVYGLYPQHRQASRAVQALLDYLAGALSLSSPSG